MATKKPQDDGDTPEEETDAEATHDAAEAGASDEGAEGASPEDGPVDVPRSGEDPADESAGGDGESAPGELVEAAGADEDDEEEFLPKDLPPPYCRRPWKEMVGGLCVVALIVAAITIYMRPDQRIAAGAGPLPSPAGGVTSPGVAAPSAMPAPPDARPVALTAAAPGRQSSAFNTAAQVTRPSVVGIRAIGPAAGAQPGFERLGSGVIVDPSGLVLTCTHVIRGASRIDVSRFRHANERMSAQIVASEGDLTLLRVATNTPLPAARFADPNQLAVGDWVLALGHPFGMGLSVSAGIVGRRNAELALPGGVRESGLVQTDASINEGSSGGPLVNLDGQVVGLNLAIFAPTGVFSGAGFAIDGARALSFVRRYAASTGGWATPPQPGPFAIRG